MKVWNTARELIEWIGHHHNPMHENGGVDEVSVEGLSGDLADLQDPKDHTHQSAGSGVGGQLDHGLAMDATSLTHNDHTQYVLHTEVDDIPVDGVTTDPISSNWAYDFSTFGNRTHITGGVISDAYDGTVDISAGTAWCKISDDLNAEGVFFSFDSANSVTVSGALSDLNINYIYLDYNGGDPQIVHDTTEALFYDYDHIILGCAFRHGTHCHIINSEWAGLDSAHSIKMRAYETFAGQRTSGLVTSSTGTRNLVITAGVIWIGVTRQTTLSFNTSTVTTGTATTTTPYRLIDATAPFTMNDEEKTVEDTVTEDKTDVVDYVSSTELRLKDDIIVSGEAYKLYDGFDTWYTSDGGTTWVQTEHETQVDNLRYNDLGEATLQTLGAAAARGVHWLYIDQEGKHLHMVYGQDSYTTAQAEIAQIPAYLPPLAANFGILIAKIIVQNGKNLLDIKYPWVTTFVSSAAQDHGNLAGLTDDDHTQYQEEDEKGVANGYASLNTNTKVTEQPASISDHLDDTEHGTDAETSKAPTSNRLYDHDVATTGVHGVGSNTIASDAQALMFALCSQEIIMIVIDTDDAIRGIAEVVEKLDFIVNGYVGTTATQLADGQMHNAEAELYASGADATVVTSIAIVNTDAAARTFTLYLKPKDGTSRAISPVSLDLGIGHSFYTDGQRMVVMDLAGQILHGWTVDDTAGGTNGLTAIPISSNVHYDHVQAADPHTGYVLESLLDAKGDGIFASANNAPAKVTVGANDTVLTADDGETAGVKWAVAVGTKEFFIPVTNGTEMIAVGFYTFARCDSSTDEAWVSFKVPHDFSTIVNAELIVIPRATQAEADWDLGSIYAAEDEAVNTHSETDNTSTYNVALSVWFAINLADILNSLEAGDYVGIKLLQHTEGHNVDVFGVRLRYSQE